MRVKCIFLLVSFLLALCESLPTYAPIVNGVPTSGFVDVGQELFYQIIVPIPLPRIVVSLFPSVGVCDLLATVSYYWDPEPGNYEWVSFGRWGEAIILIPANSSFHDPGGQCQKSDSTECPLNIGVFGSRSCNFTLVARFGTAEEVLEVGTPAVGELISSSSTGSGSIDYYNISFLEAPPPAALSFRLSGSGGGGALVSLAMYISSNSINGTPRPIPGDSTTYCASATQIPGAPIAPVIIMLSNLTSVCMCAPSPPSLTPCTYVVAVTSAAPPPPGSVPNATLDLPYSLLLTTSDEPLAYLSDGSPQFGAGTAGSASVFLFPFSPDATSAGPNVSAAAAAATIAASPTFGTIQVFVALSSAEPGGGGGIPGPGAGNYSYATSGSAGGDPLIVVSPFDPRWVGSGCLLPSPSSPSSPPPCYLTIAVWTLSPSSAYSITASTAGDTLLTSGLPTPGILIPSEGLTLARYRVFSGPLTQAISIGASASSGSITLVVGCDSSNATTSPDPSNPGSFLWSSSSDDNGGGAEVLIPAGGSGGGCTSLPCAYYIAIISNDPTRGAEFIILVRTYSGPGAAPTSLALGEVIQDAVRPQGGLSTFVIALDGSSLAAVTAQVLVEGGQGSSSAALSFFASLGPSPLLNLTSPEGAQYVGSASEGGGIPGGGAGGDVISFSVAPSDYNASGCPPPPGGGQPESPCYLTLGVLGLAAQNPQQPLAPQSYSLSSSSGLRRLSDGIPLEGSIGPAPAISLFLYEAADAGLFSLALTALDGDAPDLLMSVGGPPNASWYQWSSRGIGSKFISVNWQEPWLINSRGNFPVSFYVAVAGWDTAASYTLTVTSNPITFLEPGLPQAAELSGGKMTYFFLPIPSPYANGGAVVGFTVSVSPLSGDTAPFIFVNTVNSSRTCAHCGFPYCRTSPCDPTLVANINPWWSSARAVNPLVIPVDPSDGFYQSGCNYIVAVFAEGDATISITGTYSDAITVLQGGVPAEGVAPVVSVPSLTAYYLLPIVNLEVDLMVALTPLGSAAPLNLYVSVNSSNMRPSPNAFDKMALGSPGVALSLSFSWSEMYECPNSAAAGSIICFAWIAVVAAEGSASPTVPFSIMAEAARSNVTEILLVPGMPQFGVIRASDLTEYYTILDVPYGASYYFLLNPHGVAKVDMFVTLDGSRPTPTLYQYSSVGLNGPEVIQLTPASLGYVSNGTLRVAVHCPFVPQGGAVGYDVSFAIGSSSLVTLLPSLIFETQLQVTQAASFAFYAGTAATLPSLGGADVFYTGASGLYPQLLVGLESPPGNASYRPTPATACAALQSNPTAKPQQMHIHVGGDPATDPCACPVPSDGGLGVCRYVVTVICPGIPLKQPTCNFGLVATTGRAAPIALSDGQSFSATVAPSAYVYFVVDISSLLPAQANLTVGAEIGGGGGASIMLVASPWSSPSAPPPTLGSAVWTSDAFGPPGPSPTLTLPYTAFLASPCPACTSLLVGVFNTAASEGGGAPPLPPAEPFTIDISSSLAAASSLTLGLPSPVITDGYRTVHRYLLWLDDPTVDLSIDLTVLQGTAAVTLDPALPSAACSIGRPNPIITCTGMWRMVGSGTLLVRAADPCGGPFVNPNATNGPCVPAAVWGQMGTPYYLSVLITISPSTFIIAASQPGIAYSLSDGEPLSAAATSDAPALFSYSLSAPAQLLSPLRFLISADAALSLDWYLIVCSQDACTSADSVPSPSNPGVTMSGHILASSTGSIALSPSVTPASWCPASDASPCLFYVAIYPPSTCKVETCAAPLTIVAKSAPSGGAGGAPVEITWPSIAGQVATLTTSYVGGGQEGRGRRDAMVLPPSVIRRHSSVVSPPKDMSATETKAVAAASAAADAPALAIEIYLSPITTQGQLTYVRILIESCGPSLPSLYACDPSLPGGQACKNPFSPSPTDFSSMNSSAASGGIVSLVFPSTTAIALFLSLAGGGADAPSLGQTDFTLRLSALSSALLLVQGTIVTANVTSSGISLDWMPALLVGGDGVTTVFPTGLLYTVYVAPSGFSSCATLPPPILASTSCGLERWYSGNCAGALKVPISTRDAMGAVIPLAALPASTTYVEVTVVATCDALCWQASLPRSSTQTSLAPQSSASTRTMGVNVTVPPPAPPPPSNGAASGSSGLSAGAAAGISITVILIVGIAGVLMSPLRSKVLSAVFSVTSLSSYQHGSSTDAPTGSYMRINSSAASDEMLNRSPSVEMSMSPKLQGRKESSALQNFTLDS